MTDETTLAHRLTAATTGDRIAEAAVYIITTTVNGTLVDKLADVIDDEPTCGRAWIDWPQAIETSQPFSGGERRLIALAASLHQGTPVSLADTLSGLDEANAHHVLTALADALGVKR